MADEPMGVQPAGSGLPKAVMPLAPSCDGDDFELGYEAADPLLLERLWGDDAVRWPAEHHP